MFVAYQLGLATVSGVRIPPAVSDAGRQCTLFGRHPTGIVDFVIVGLFLSGKIYTRVRCTPFKRVLYTYLAAGAPTDVNKET